MRFSDWLLKPPKGKRSKTECPETRPLRAIHGLIPSPVLISPTLKKSKVCTLNDGEVRRFPELCDYLERYVSQGMVKDVTDLIENYSHLIGEIFFNWISTGQLGCIFAAKLARKPRENRWHSVVQLQALTEGDRLGQLISAHLDGASDTHEAAAIIFPDVVGEQAIVDLVNLLCSDPSGRWYRTDDGIDPDPAAARSFIGLRWILKRGTAVNYVLGFSPIDSMPRTRQSPFTALFFRIKEDKRTPSDLEDGRTQVHLADLDSTFATQAAHDKILELTKTTRANFVEPHLTAAARARITFAVSSDFAASLCPAKHVVREKCHD